MTSSDTALFRLLSSRGFFFQFFVGSGILVIRLPYFIRILIVGVVILGLSWLSSRVYYPFGHDPKSYVCLVGTERYGQVSIPATESRDHE